MRRIFPPGDGAELDTAALEELYRYPADPTWLAVNYVSSVDGAVTIDGRSQGLSTGADRIVYGLGSDLADVVLLGAGTAVNEGFDGIHPDEASADRRARHGLAPVPPIAVVTSGASLPPDAPVLTKATVPTIVITSAAADPDRCAAYRAAGADVLTAGESDVDLAVALAELHRRGLRRVDCEGGPGLFGKLLAADLVDELRLTLSPMLVAGDAGRIATGPTIDPARLDLATALLAEDSSLLLRYLVRH